ncbi:DUF1838 family protein [Parasphingopyxis sp. CP4]|uniref:DUF1838 family protein n=1 Tax=Parasphingopyxis sp. CP4 TaxID=2724527 RepID=UPI0015A3A535|nr:DUF1838 family protein [Parasphingopyxis sp. CP4]QLC23080.1 DUF1838 family protein [Parasphingopyxis sp. CP4]
MGLKKLTLACATMALAGMGMAAEARTLDPNVPEDAVEISKRLQCGEADGEPAVYYWSGRGYSRVRGERDRHVFNLEGMNIRQCVSVTDPERGTGYRQVSREIMLYTDPETGEVLREWENPWTGETVPVMHVANDPVNMRAPNFPVGRDGSPYSISTYRQIGDWVLIPFEVPLFYTNPLGGDYQEYVGNMYQAMEIFDFAARADDILDTDNATAYPTVSWVRVAAWLPWMRMRSREGQMIFNAVGSKLRGGYDELPEVLRNEIEANYPEYTAPPPGDDARPNATTWTVFRQMIDEMRAAEGEDSPAAGHSE